MKKAKKQFIYEFFASGYTDTSQIPKGDDLYYHCLRCGDIYPSWPKDNENCTCNNIVIDIDMNRLAVEDFTKFEVDKKVLKG